MGKHWLFQGSEKRNVALLFDDRLADKACQGYESVLDPPRMVKDVAYWFNKHLETRGIDFSCINASVEESALCDREYRRLLPQDEFIKTKIKEDDILVVSIGGNDVALKPSEKTQLALLQMLNSRQDTMQFRMGLCHLVSMFKNDVETWINKLVSRRRPRVIVVCMVYFLDEQPGNGWCEAALASMGYNRDPSILQNHIRLVYNEATSKIQIPGTTVIPVPLFEVLTGKDTSDYCQRVEPSIKGGENMARYIVETLWRRSAFAPAGPLPRAGFPSSGTRTSGGGGLNY